LPTVYNIFATGGTMRKKSILSYVILASSAALMAGCSHAAPTTEATTPGFVDSTGQAKTTPASYPAPPYGYEVGSVVQPFEFYGFPNPMTNNSKLAAISLADFYNPHAFDKTYQPAQGEQDDRVFPSDSGYALAGKQKPTVMLVDIASVWCGPCNDEAGHMLPMKHDLYAACGGEFLLNLHDSLTPGITATQTNLRNWTKAYRVNFPAWIDPEYKLDPLFAEDVFPSNLVIDTTTMKIVQVVAGETIPGACSDMSAFCGTAADLALCNDPTKGLSCSVQGTPLAGCAAPATCVPDKLWTVFEKHLDKSRAGCTVQ
jgi:hypothetical protein